MSDRLREALDWYENDRPRQLNNWANLDVMAAAAESWLALTHKPCTACGGPGKFFGHSRHGTEPTSTCEHCGGTGFDAVREVIALGLHDAYCEELECDTDTDHSVRWLAFADVALGALRSADLPAHWWCLTHDAQGFKLPEPFDPSCFGNRPGDSTDKPCRLIRVALVELEDW